MLRPDLKYSVSHEQVHVSNDVWRAVKGSVKEIQFGCLEKWHSHGIQEYRMGSSAWPLFSVEMSQDLTSAPQPASELRRRPMNPKKSSSMASDPST